MNVLKDDEVDDDGEEDSVIQEPNTYNLYTNNNE